MNTIRHRLFTNWHFMRSVRLGFGLLLLLVAILTKDLSSLPFSAFFLFTAITGVWCCDVNGSYASNRNGAHKDIADTN
jgi:CDP-diglyceride synthetase